MIGFLSFSSLDAGEYGLDYSFITKNIDVTVYGPGFHFLGFGHSFLVYPSTVQNMEFSDERSATRPPIESRTDDGLMITFKVSFQYRLLDTRLYDLYYKYGEDYSTPCQKYAIDILND
jgi:regulator of protease activity HflC (stomatin/prohibitin superfamily)